jgi:hypothetical protein
MNKKLKIAVFFIVLMVSTAAGAEVKPGSIKVLDRPSPEKGPTKIEIAILLMDVDSIDSASQTFVSNILVSLSWKDPRLTHSGGGPIKYPLDKIWEPTLQIINESGLVRKTFPEFATVQPDGTVTYKQRYVGSFSQPLKLHDFPFDQHKFRIHFIATSDTPENVQFVPEKKWIDRGLPYAANILSDISLPDWKIYEFKTENVPFKVFKGYALAGYVFEFSAKRQVEYYFLKVIMPLFLIVMMSWVVFWIDPKNSGTQIGLASTSMLTLIAYRFAIDTQVPKVPYTTRIDEFVLMGTVIVFIALIQAVITSMLAQSNKVNLARKVDIISRIIFPVVFFTGAFFTLLR